MSWIVDEHNNRLRPAATESGYWRARPDNGVELLLAHPTGFVEVWLGRVEVTTRQGAVLQGRIDEPKGDPGNPLSDAELEDKFRANVEPVFGAAQAIRLRDAILRLADGGPVGALSAAMVPGG